MEIKLNQVESVDLKQAVTVKGILTKLYPPKTGEGSYGPWLLQGFEMEDTTGTVPGTLSLSGDKAHQGGHTIPLEWKGHLVEFSPFPSVKHGLIGVTVENDKFKGCRIIKLTGTANMKICDDIPVVEDMTPDFVKEDGIDYKANYESPPSKIAREKEKKMSDTTHDFYKECSDGVPSIIDHIIDNHKEALEKMDSNGIDKSEFLKIATSIFIERNKKRY